jgi:hypothetical protein
MLFVAWQIGRAEGLTGDPVKKVGGKKQQS